MTTGDEEKGYQKPDMFTPHRGRTPLRMVIHRHTLMEIPLPSCKAQSVVQALQDGDHPVRPNWRVYLTISDRACGPFHRKKPSASRPSLKTTNKPVPAVLSQPNRALAVHTRA